LPLIAYRPIRTNSFHRDCRDMVIVCAAVSMMNVR